MAERIECDACNVGEHADCEDPPRCPCSCTPRLGRACSGQPCTCKGAAGTTPQLASTFGRMDWRPPGVDAA